MKKTLIFLSGIFLAGLLLMTAGQVHSQDVQEISAEELRQYIGEEGVYRTRTSRRVKGTPYLNKDWKMGHIILNQKSRSEQLPLRMNTFEQEIEFVRDDEVFAIPPQNVDGFVIYNEFGNILFKNGYRSEEHEVNPSTLLRVVHEGQTKLLVHHKTHLQQDMASYGMASKLDEYIDSRSYYLVTPDGSFNEIRLRKRDILRQLDDHREEIEEFAKQNNLDYSEEPEVATMLNHYDSLIQQQAGSGS